MPWKVATSSSPTLLFTSINTTGEGTWNFGGGGSAGVVGSKAAQQSFTNATTRNVTAIKFLLDSLGTVTGRTLFCQIYNASGTALGSSVATSNGVTGAAWTKQLIEFTFTGGATLTGGNTYHVLIYSAQDAFGGSFNTYYTNPSVISGQLSLFDTSGTNSYPSTFPGYDLQVEIWGTTP